VGQMPRWVGQMPRWVGQMPRWGWDRCPAGWDRCPAGGWDKCPAGVGQMTRDPMSPMDIFLSGPHLRTVRKPDTSPLDFLNPGSAANEIASSNLNQILTLLWTDVFKGVVAGDCPPFYDAGSFELLHC